MVQLGWTVTDELLCIQEDGSVLIYDLFGSFKRHFSMGQVSPSTTQLTHMCARESIRLVQAGRLLLLSLTGSGSESGAGSQSLSFSVRDGRGHREWLIPFHLGDQH